MKREWKGSIFKLALTLLLLVLIWSLSLSLLSKTEKDKSEELKKAIQTASIECYAVEGMYPPNIEYLEENYGIQIDRSKYNVFYNGFASNLLPDITIVEVENNER